MVGSAIAIGIFGYFLTHLGGRLSGWTGYAPLALHRAMPPWGRFLIWLALVLIWTAFAYWLMRPVSRDRDGETGQ